MDATEELQTGLAFAPFGAATLVATVVAGQMVASLVLDTRGWVGFAQQPLTISRLCGGLLVIAGVLLINRR